MIWFTSDFHFGHNKEFIWRARGYNSLYEMEADLIHKYNSVVEDNDTVYILGDLAVGEFATDGILKCVPQLCGNKIIIMGNHDTDARVTEYRNILGIPVLGVERLRYRKYSFFLSHYPSITNNYDDDKPLRARVINLCGHSHTTDPFFLMRKGILSYHVEVDAHGGYPVPIEIILDDIQQFEKNRSPLLE